MMCGHSIRRLTPEEIDARRDAAQANYDRIYAEIEDAQRAEYEAEFGEEYRAKYPFKADGSEIHQQVQSRIVRESSE